MADIDATTILVGTNTNTSGTTAQVTPTLTAGRSAEVCVISASGATHNVPTSVPAEDWQLIATLNDGATDAMRMSIYRADDVTGGSTVITETYSGSVGNRLIAVKEIFNTSGYNAAAAAFNAQMQNAPGTGTDVVTSGATPTLTSQPALFSGWVLEKSFNNAAPTAGTGYDDDGSGGNGIAGLASVRSISKRVTATTGQAATFTNATDRRYFTFVAAYLEAPAGPTITGGTANPVHLSTGNTITGTGFGASQGAGTLVIGGQAQTVTAWADTSITYTANRGVNLNDVAVNAVVTDNGGTPSANYALTGFDPPAGYYFVTLTSVNATAANRITAIADLAIGNQLEWDNADVTINNDATWDAADTVTSFNVRAGVTTDGWGSLGLQTINLGGASAGRAIGLGLRLGRVVYA